MGERKNFNELRSKMGPERVARADECAQKMLDGLIIDGLESGEPVDMDDAYWANLRRRVAKTH
jgi:hypothetical protein